MASSALQSNDFYLSLSDLAAVCNETPEQTLAGLEKLFGPQKSKAFVAPTQVRRYLSSKGYQYPHKVFSFQMLKGGVAKTTSALNFGLRAAMYGARVLFIDLDQQANLTFALGVEGDELPVWVDIVEKKNTVESALVKIDEGIDLIPSSLNNSVLDRVLMNSNRNWSQAVAGPLKEVRSFYDIVVIDTAPSLSVTNTAVTCASDVVVLPINPDKFSLLGLDKNLQDLAELREEFNLKFEEKILFTKYDARETASREILAQCGEKFDDRLIKSYIRTSSEIKNSIRGKRHLFSAKSTAKADYDMVTREMIQLEIR